MNERGESDRPVVPQKSAKMDYWDFHRWYVERMEGRGLAKENGEGGGNADLSQAGPSKQVDRTQSRVGAGDACPEDLQSALDRVRQAACRDVSRCAPARHHPRQEPGAVVPLAGIRAGGGGQPPSLPQPIDSAEKPLISPKRPAFLASERRSNGL